MPFNNKKKPIRRVKVVRKRATPKPKRKTMRRFPKVNSIRNTYYSLISEDSYFQVITNKDTALTPFFQTSGTVQQNIGDLVAASQPLVVFESCFRNARVVSLKITLTPETTIGNVFTADAAQKPKIMWINDDGSVGNFRQSVSLSSQEAKGYGKIYHEAEFRKPFVFFIKLYQKQNLLGTDKYLSASQWRNTPKTGVVDVYTTAIPNQNLWFGFQDIPAGFQYKTHFECVCDYKNPTFIS